MQKIERVFLFMFCLLMAMAETAIAAEPLYGTFEGQVIEEIRFEGNEVVPDDTLCGVLTFGEGDSFSEENLEQARQTILKLNKFKTVWFRVTQGDKGVILTFVLEERWYVMTVPGIDKEPRSAFTCKAKIPDSILSDLEGLPVEEIRFEGNKVTRDIVLRDELYFHKGDPFNKEKFIKSRQSIQNLGLFKWVYARAERGKKGVIVTYTVSEKWYLIPIPRLGRNADGDISYGGELRWDNALGLNQQFKLISEQEDLANGETEQRASLQYSIAKIPLTAYGVGSSIERKRTLKDSVDDAGVTLGQYYEYQDAFNVTVSRWLKRTAPSQGWKGNVGMSWRRNSFQTASGEPVLEGDHRQLDLGTSAGFSAVNDHEFYRSGEEYGAGVGFGREALGSDENFYNVSVYWRRYNPIYVPIWSNVNFQLRTGFNHGQDNVFSLGGSDSMRGILEENAPQGDMYALLNVNWLIPLSKYPALRWNIFTDIGNAWPREDINLLKWEATAGVGARWKIRSLVNVSLRLDIGYNPATGDYKVYAGTNQMF
jgi:outer membrane protein insertion porin family